MAILGTYVGSFGDGPFPTPPPPPPPPLVTELYMVGATTTGSGSQILELDLNGNEVDRWGIGQPLDIYGVARDSSGNIYVSSFSYASGSIGTIKKYDSSKTLLLTINIGSQYSFGVALDGTNIYGVSDKGTSGTSLRKWNSSGTGLWGATRGGETSYRVTITPGGSNVHICGDRTAFDNTSIMKLNSSGAISWRRDSINSSSDIAVDTSGNVYSVGGSAGSNVKKYNSSGTLQWAATTSYAYAVKVDSSGNVYVGGNSFRKYNSTGGTIWNITSGFNAILSLDLDSNNNIYIAGIHPSNVEVRCFDTNGNLLWTKTNSGGNTIIGNDLIII
jgi:hypothetical protein